MKIIFVRHGHPDYKSGHLTELGHRHAQLAAERLADEGISQIYTSPLTRAVETATYTANLLQLEIRTLECIREISWGSEADAPLVHKGHPWHIVGDMAHTAQSLTDTDWRTKEGFAGNTIHSHLTRVTQGFDDFLLEKGYVREGQAYRITENACADTIAIFGHGGSFSAILSHLTSIPFPLACHIFDLNFTCISIANFDLPPYLYCTPRFEVIGDAHHIRNADLTANTFLA